MTSTEGKRKRRIGLRNSVMLSLNGLSIFFLLLSYTAGHISPDSFWLLALFGLAYPLLLAANFFFMMWWLFLRRMFFLFSLLAILAGYPELKATFAFNTSIPENKEAIHAGNTIKVMTFNTRLFDLYNWTHNIETRERIFFMLKNESPDIICFQEFFDSEREPYRNIDKLNKIIRARNYHVDYSSHVRNIDHWGIATYSAFPIIGKKTIRFGRKGGNLCLATDVVIGNDTVRIFNVHLESIRFKPEDYRFVENIGTDKESQEMKKSKRIIGKLKVAFERRARQADLLRYEMENSPFKVIICGDFNDTPTSYTYETISKNLTDAFIESGSGMSQTYAGAFPSFRIDYILHDRRFTSSGYEVIHENFSDHYPVKCFITIRK